MDQNFTDSLKKWLETPAAERDNAAGAMMLLRLTRNRVQYNFLARKLAENASFIARELQKHYELRVSGITHADAIAAQVEAMAAAEKHVGLAVEADSNPHRGRRADHDTLPAEIQKLWDDNLELKRRLRDAHAKLRVLSSDTAPCSDADRMVFVKELKALDVAIRTNYKEYDQYIPE